MQTFIGLLLRAGCCFLISLGLWYGMGGAAGVARGEKANPADLMIFLLMAIPWFILFGKPLIELCGDMMGRFWIPSDSAFEVRPQYSIAEAREKEGNYEAAIARYRQ